MKHQIILDRSGKARLKGHKVYRCKKCPISWEGTSKKGVIDMANMLVPDCNYSFK